MKREFTRRLSLLLMLCLLLSAPAALMEAEEEIEGPVAEIAQEIGEIAEAVEEETTAADAADAGGDEAQEAIEVIECVDGDTHFIWRGTQARLVPAGDVAAKSFKSSNTAIVKVDKTGLVTIPDDVRGRADVTITLKNGDVITVHVAIAYGGREGSWGVLVPIDLNIRMNVGDSLKLKIDSFLEEGEVTPKEWRTSDKAVATVSKDGVVKAKKAGTVEIEVDLQTPNGGGYAQRFIKVIDPGAKAEGGADIDEKHFPDAVFREYVRYFYDTDDDGKLSKSEGARATRLVYDCDGVKSLTGIEYLTGLKHIELYRSQGIAALDLSKNTKLEHLGLEDPHELTVKTLNLSKNTRLTALNTQHGEKMGYPDPSQFKKLREVSVGDLGKAKSLDFSANAELQEASIWDNGNLTSLKIKNLSKLKELEVDGNEKLKTLDITGNAALKKLMVCGNDRLKTLDISGCTLLIDLVNSVDPTIDKERDEIIYTSKDRQFRMNGDMTLPGTGIYPTFELASSATHSAYVGESFRLTLASAKAKSFKSSRTSVAKVSKYGVVTPVKAGKATVTVTLSKGKTRKLTLTVLDPDAVTIAQGKTASLKVKGTLTLKAEVHNPATLTWSSSNKSVATVNARTGKVTAVAPGTTNITTKSDKGKKATIKITVTR